jgi:hypothetical protein
MISGGDPMEEIIFLRATLRKLLLMRSVDIFSKEPAQIDVRKQSKLPPFSTE